MDNRTRESNEANREKADISLLEGLEQELCKDMTEDELSRLVSGLTRMPTALPDESFMDEALHRWRRAGAAGALSAPAVRSNAVGMDIWRTLKAVISHSRLAFLWQGLAFYLAGFFWLQGSAGLSPLFILPIIAATPFLIGVIGIARWFEHGMLELMMSFKLKLARYLNACFLFIGLYSLLLNTAFTFILSGRGFDWGLVALHWSIPGIITAAAAIFLCTRLKNLRALAGSYAAFPIMSLLLYGNRSVQNLLFGLDMITIGVAFAISVIIFGAAFTDAARHIRNGGMLIGART